MRDCECALSNESEVLPVAEHVLRYSGELGHVGAGGDTEGH